MPTKLKPCPFCGGRAKIYTVFDKITKIFGITCQKCGVGSTQWTGDVKKVAEDWNRRV